MLGCVAFVIKPSDALFHPPLEGSMDGLRTGLHIAGNAGQYAALPHGGERQPGGVQQGPRSPPRVGSADEWW